MCHINVNQGRELVSLIGDDLVHRLFVYAIGIRFYDNIGAISW